MRELTHDGTITYWTVHIPSLRRILVSGKCSALSHLYSYSNEDNQKLLLVIRNSSAAFYTLAYCLALVESEVKGKD